MPEIKVAENQKYPRVYWPPELVREGFIGNIQVLNDSFIALLIHPAATLEQVKKSLELKVKDVELRLEKEKGAGGDGVK